MPTTIKAYSTTTHPPNAKYRAILYPYIYKKARITHKQLLFVLTPCCLYCILFRLIQSSSSTLTSTPFL